MAFCAMTQPVLEALAESPAQPQTHARSEDHLVLAAALQFQALDAVEVHDDRPVDADEAVLAELPLEFRQRAPNDVRGRPTCRQA